jgi:hypothetical protein
MTDLCGGSEEWKGEKKRSPMEVKRGKQRRCGGRTDSGRGGWVKKTRRREVMIEEHRAKAYWQSFPY